MHSPVSKNLYTRFSPDNAQQQRVLCKSPVPDTREQRQKQLEEFRRNYYPKIGLVKEVFGKRQRIRSRFVPALSCNRSDRHKNKEQPTCMNIQTYLIPPPSKFRIVDKSEYLKMKEQSSLDVLKL